MSSSDRLASQQLASGDHLDRQTSRANNDNLTNTNNQPGQQQHSATGDASNNSFNAQQQQTTITTTTFMSSNVAAAGQASATPTPCSRELEIQHLIKLLHEIKYYQASSSPLPSATSSPSHRDFLEKIHRALPLFLNVFSNEPELMLPAASGTITACDNTKNSQQQLQPQPAARTNAIHRISNNSVFNMHALSQSISIDLSEHNSNSDSILSIPNSPLTSGATTITPRSRQMDTFPDLLPFTYTIARLFVSQVRQKASNKRAEDASMAILEFVKPPIESSVENQTQLNQPDEQANAAIRDEKLSDRQNGWDLLLSLNTLANSQNQQIIQYLCDASLPSTSIKCLYLFFDLRYKSVNSPRTEPNEQASTDNEANLPTLDPRSIEPLIKAFTQLLVRLCSNQAAIQELIKKDDLRLLMGLASSQCQPQNKPWRKTAFQTLLAISRSMRDNFHYLQENLCIQKYVENMHRINSLGLVSLDEFVDMIRVLLEFVYNLDSNNRNQPRAIASLIEQFQTSRLIDLIEELIYKIDNSIEELSDSSNNNNDQDPTTGPSDSAESCQSTIADLLDSERNLRIHELRRSGRKLITSLTVMAKISFSIDVMREIMTLKPLAMSRYEMFEQFKMPKPSAKDCILNYDTLRLMKSAWAKCHDGYLNEAILDTTISLFNDDRYNYFVFESQQLLVYYMTSYNFKQFPYKVKQKLFKFLEFIIIETNYIPCLELSSLGQLITSQLSHGTSTDTPKQCGNDNIVNNQRDESIYSDLMLALRTLIAALQFQPKFSDKFRELSLLDVITETLIYIMQQYQENISATNFRVEAFEALYLTLETTQYLLSGPNNSNCAQFNESRAARYVFNCLADPRFFHQYLSPHNSNSDDSAASGNQLFEQTNKTPNMSASSTSFSPTLSHSTPTMSKSTFQGGVSRLAVKQLQKVAFAIIRQLILSSAGDQHLANLLGLLARNSEDISKTSLEQTSHGASTCTTPINCENSHLLSNDYGSILSQEINLKICVLKSLMIILKESHRCRTLFRKTGGFTCVVSAIQSLEKSLAHIETPKNQRPDNTKAGWQSINSRRIWRLLKDSFATIMVAMRYEPSNIRAFTEDELSSFTEALRKIGCFKAHQLSLPSKTIEDVVKDRELFDTNLIKYKTIFHASPTRDLSTVCNDNLQADEYCCQFFRFLFDMALDMPEGITNLDQIDAELSLYGKLPLNRPYSQMIPQSPVGHASNQHPSAVTLKSISFDRGSSFMESNILKRRSHLSTAPKRPPSLDLISTSQNSVILAFPSVILSIVDLIPSCSEDLMILVSLVIKSLFQHERNQQLLCETGLINKLLDIKFRVALTDKKHFLHDYYQFMIENLTKHSITPKELRTFLRIEEPLRSRNLDDIELNETEQHLVKMMIKKEKIPNGRIEVLVAMMNQSGNSKAQPPFIEFDLNTDSGFSLIFMPSIAPINVKSLPPSSSAFLNSTLDIHTTERNGILGGVGNAERAFPPPNGLTFSSWICIEKFPSRSSESNQNLRLLTIYRGSAATGKEYSCLRVQISALDRALTISTKESLLFDNEIDRSADHNNQFDHETNMRVWTPELLIEGRWHHLVISIQRSNSKSQSHASLYVDGLLAHQQRLAYISGLVGPKSSSPIGASSGSANVSAPAAFVNAFIGTLPQFRYQSQTRWKQGPFHLVENALSSSLIAAIYALGPSYAGNLQSSCKLSDLAKSRLSYLGQCEPKYQKHHQQSQQGNAFSESPTSQSSHLSHHQSMINRSGNQHSSESRLMRAATQNQPALAHQRQVSPSSCSPTCGSGGFGGHQNSISEDRVLISIDARATSMLTIARMRRIYTRFDCRQISRVLCLSTNENSTPIMLMHNTGLHLTGPSRGVGAVTVGYNQVRCFVPKPIDQTLFNIGGCYILLAFVAQAETTESFACSMSALVCALKQNVTLQAQMDQIDGYQILALFYRQKKHLISNQTIKLIFSLVTEATKTPHYDQVPLKTSTVKGKTPIIQQVGAMRDLVCECFDLWMQTGKIDLVLEFIYNLISSTSSQNSQSDNSILPIQAVSSSSSTARNRNLTCLWDLDLLPRILRLLPQYDSTSDQAEQSQIKLKPTGNRGQIEETGNEPSSLVSEQQFDTKEIYLIKQTVFELLNRTPRQSDLLYFGQFLASLLPTERNCERSPQTISLRNILLKSLLQMMTRNKQQEINNAMQEELVRILGFDWFLLFIQANGDSQIVLDRETISIGCLNLMILFSNRELYAKFKSNSKNSAITNGGWLKEPTFPTIDGKFNIQLLGVNVGVFFGLSGKRKSIKQDVLEAPNLFLFVNGLCDLVELPSVYLMIFLVIMNKLNIMDQSVLDTIAAFDVLTFDSLCDNLVGDTHQKRRKALSSIQLRCHELVVCVVYMLKQIMSKTGQTNTSSYPMEVIKFLMYLYNNNRDFQQYCTHSSDFIDSLCETLMVSPDMSESKKSDQDLSPRQRQKKTPSQTRHMTGHSASKEVFELSRLIILDSMTDCSSVQGPENIGSFEQLQSFKRFIDSLSSCHEAQGELVEMLLHQILLMIDSTGRQNSFKTIASTDTVVQFQLLLVNSITISQVVTDKIWLAELYEHSLSKVLTIIDHQLCLTEQVFKFNELLPKNQPPHAFIMQRTLNRLLLSALSRPATRMSDRVLLFELLKKIYDNRTIIIINHMNSPQSTEFFVCFTYCLMKLMEENNITASSSFDARCTNNQRPQSLIERQFVNQRTADVNKLSPTHSSSSTLMLVSMARKVWDTIYQSKRDLLAEALDVSLSLPAFTLETSLDLLQLKAEINDTCERFWVNYIDAESKPKRRLQSQQREPQETASAQTQNTGSSAVNLLSNRLTKVVNAASFVSRVVGATAGSVASNVNLVGDRLAQTGRATNREQSSEFANLTSSTDNKTAAAISTSSANNSCQDQSSLDHSREDNQFLYRNLTKHQIDDASRCHISIIDDYIRSQSSQKNHKLALHKYVADEWLDTEFEVLLRERALFGPTRGSVLDKWCLDMTEGPRRMRKKMFNNTKQFFEHYSYSPEQFNPDNKSLRYRPPMSFDSYCYFLKMLKIDQHFFEVQDNTKELTVGADQAQVGLQTDLKVAQNGDIQSSSINDELRLAMQDMSMSATSSASNKSQQHESLNNPIRDSSQVAPTTSDVQSSLAVRIEAAPLSPLPSPSPRLGSEPGDNDDGDSSSFVDFSPEIEAESCSARESENIDSLSVLRLLEKNERISHMFRCSRVQGLDTYEGLLLFGREHFYLIDGFTLLKTREIKDIDSLPPDSHDPIIPNSTPNILSQKSKKSCAKFSFESVVEVHKRRYLLQPIALEVFSSDGRNTLIVFPRNIRNKVFSRLMTVSTQLNSNAHESLAGQKSTVSVEGGSGLLSNLIGETSVTQRWVRGELSNFQYLMNLNTIAGRSYNDLMQYPIFPWVLADYTSESLDFTKQSTFRNLSRPVGAQTSDRLEQFKRRYAEWDDTETPPYHYGTFYSSAMIVASFMVRMEPFTQHFLRLQGGHFDLADRMFHSINDSWMSASKHNMADIKELVPEFFYLPEFLMNNNRYDLGIKQNGIKLDNVILPPWAKDDPREFIRIHRSALESEYVSAHLHEWIDLIFGHKQQGQAAVDAVNVFHHLFYEGNVDIYNTDIDPIKKNAVIGFINNFGQVPKQLFKKPHPARKVISMTGSGMVSSSTTPSPQMLLPSLSAAAGQQSLQRNLTNFPQSLRPVNSNFKDLRGPIGQIVQIDKSIVAVEQNKQLIPPEYCRYVAWGYADRSLRLGLYDSEKPIFVWEGNDSHLLDEILACTIPNSRTMITAGTGSLITVWKIEKMKSFSPVMHLYGHVEPVTCLASSQAYSLIVSGSRDKTALVWDLNKFTFLRQLGQLEEDAKTCNTITHCGPVSAIAINDSTGDIATCASSWLYLWTINGELLAHIDSASVGVQHQPQFSVSSSVMPNMGQLHLLSVCFSQYNEWSSDEVILTGASDGSVSIWSMRYTQVAIKDKKEQQHDIEPAHVVKDQPQQASCEISGPGDAQQQSDGGGNSSPEFCDKADADDDQQSVSNKAFNQKTSEPINIQPSSRRRTDTMNSEWVRLSNSSTSPLDTGPASHTTPTSLCNTSDTSLLGMPNSPRPDVFHVCTNDGEQDSIQMDPKCSTPIQFTSEPSRKDESPIATSTGLGHQTTMSKMNLLNLSLNDSASSPQDPSQFPMKFSKSDNSLIESFVMLGNDTADHSSERGQQAHTDQQTGPNRARPQSSIGCARPSLASQSGMKGRRQPPTLAGPDGLKLVPNHKWKREIYLRSMLHRRDGRGPSAAVTSLSVSKDHKTVHVGDANGRVSSWSVT